MASAFRSAGEFREVVDRVFAMMSDDPVMGPRLRVADVRQRFEFPDVGMAVNVRPAAPDEDGNLRWAWGDEVGWDPRVRMTMSADIANRYFQGKENIAIAAARRRIRTSGDLHAAIAMIPMTRPVFARYRAMLEHEYPHLVA